MLTCLLVAYMLANIYEVLKIAGPGVSRHSDIEGQLSHTRTSRKACTGTANIGTDLWVFWCVLRT